ncbi:MAG: heme ABC exporter ATP-binding protein CcmA [Rickettsiales bacterium]|nr:heme ABC exporter ATP-binding protein CcmA [Rickettsiales bacterium]
MFLSFQNITYSYGERAILEDDGYTMFEGGCLVIKGANGSGKTTLLKILAGLIVPKNGFVYYDFSSTSHPEIEGASVFEISEDYQKYQQNISYIGHNLAVDQLLSVRENLNFWAEIYNLKEGILPAIKYFELEDFLDTECSKLSAGWQKRVALARLILKKSKLWILDEPFANLDENISSKLQNLIASFCDRGGMVILTAHQEVKLPFGVEINL